MTTCDDIRAAMERVAGLRADGILHAGWREDLRTLLRIAEAAVAETRAEDEEEAAFDRYEELFNGIAYEQHDDAVRDLIDAKAARRAACRGEG